MAEVFAALGVVASVAQLADYGFKLSLKLYTFSSAVSTASTSIRTLSSDVSLTSTVLQELCHIIRSDDSHVVSNSAIEATSQTVKSCLEVFAELEDVLDKSLGRMEEGRKGKAALEKLKWPFKQPRMELLRSNLDRLKASLTLMLQVLTYARDVSSRKAADSSLAYQKTLIESLARSEQAMKKRYADMQKTLQYTNSDGTVSALINTSVNMNFYREVTAQQPTAEREVTPEQPSHLNIQGDLGPSPTTKDGSVLGELLLCIQLLNDILKSHLTATASRSPMSPTYVYDSLANILSTITRRETHSLDNDDGSDRLKAEASTNLRIRLRKVVRDNNTESLNIGITEGSEVRNKIKLETNSEVVEDVPGGGNSDFKHHPTDGYYYPPSIPMSEAVRLETNSRPWKCPELDCRYHEYGWPTEEEMDRHHHDKHLLAPPFYYCHYRPCPYRSKRESNCKQHMEKAHGFIYIRSKNNGRKSDATNVNSGLPLPQLTSMQTPSSDENHTTTPERTHPQTGLDCDQSAQNNDLNFPLYSPEDFESPADPSGMNPAMGFAGLMPTSENDSFLLGMEESSSPNDPYLSNPHSSSIQAQIDETTKVMRENIDKVLHHGERLDSLQDKTDNMSVSAQGFRRGANRVRKITVWSSVLQGIANIGNEGLKAAQGVGNTIYHAGEALLAYSEEPIEEVASPVKIVGGKFEDLRDEVEDEDEKETEDEESSDADVVADLLSAWTNLPREGENVRTTSPVVINDDLEKD